MKKIIKIINEEIQSMHFPYYRATDEFLGEKVLFEPKGYYEGIDDRGDPIYKYDTFWVSDTPEVAASKYVGGAVLGASSMFRVGEKLTPNSILYIYGINQKPDVDISHWRLQDFEYLEEVRYRTPVDGIYLGKVILRTDMVKIIDSFYELMSFDEYQYEIPEEDSEEYKELFKVNEMIENGTFDRMLKNIKPQ